VNWNSLCGILPELSRPAARAHARKDMTSPGETRSVFVHTSEVRRDAAASEAVSSMEEEREGASSYASETESPSAPASLAKGRTCGEERRMAVGGEQ